MTTEARRVLIVAGCFADAGPAIGLGVELARHSRAALVGVLAREPALEAATGAPLLSARPWQRAPSLTAEDLGRAWAADARAFSARLARVAVAASLHWEFRADSGMSAELACTIRQPGDVVVLGYRRLMNLRGPVVTLGLAPEAGAEGLATALARALGVRVLTLPLDAADDPARIEDLSASALLVGPEIARHPDRLLPLIEAARCPVLIAPDRPV